MPNPRRKHVLLLVEGRSDAFALSKQLKQLLNRKDPGLVLHILLPRDGYSHDITVESVDHPSGIEGIINKAFIHQFMAQYSLLPKDIVRVIQIVDLDGAYITDEHVRNGDGSPVYAEDGIYTSNVDGIRQRNRRKRSNLDYLAKARSIGVFQRENDDTGSRKKSYSIYYFSSNLDHFLYGDANVPLEEKTEKARAFSRACEVNPNQFYDLFFREEEEIIRKRSKKDSKIKGKADQYFGSWDYIRNGVNSLQPHSNLCVLIRELMDQSNCYLE